MPRVNHLGLRLSDDELARLLQAAAAVELRPSAWLRLVALASLPAGALTTQAAPEPTGTGRLTRTVGTRLSAEQYAALAERARECGLPVAAFIRRTLLGGAPAARPRRGDVRPAIAALNQVGNNLNQLTKLAHQGLVLPGELAPTVARVLAEVRRVRDALLQVDE